MAGIIPQYVSVILLEQHEKVCPSSDANKRIQTLFYSFEGIEPRLSPLLNISTLSDLHSSTHITCMR